MSDLDLRVQKYIQRLQSSDETVRLHAGCRLGQLGASAKVAVPALLELLRSASVSDRKLAAWTLGYIGLGAIEATPALLQASRDDDQGVRWMVASALEKIAPSTNRAAA